MCLTLVTPTGDRPESFALCERWMSRQTAKWTQWIVTDDGHDPAQITMGQQLIRLPRMKGHSLTRNLADALKWVKTEYVAIIEDDDYYAPTYLEQLLELLSRAPLAGFCANRYYHLEHGYRQWDNRANASLCATGFHWSVIPKIQRICNRVECLIDMALWDEWDKDKVLAAPDPLPVVGIKGMPGRPGVTYRDKKPGFYKPDPDQAVFKNWVGDWKEYEIHMGRKPGGATEIGDVVPFVVSGDWSRKAQFAYDNPQNGCFIVDHDLHPTTMKIAERCREVNSPCVIGFFDDVCSPNETHIRDLMAFSTQLAIANDKQFSEFKIRPLGIDPYLRLANDMGFTWHCSIMHSNICYDLRGRGLRDKLAEANVTCWCLCGYMLSQYVLGRALPTFKTSLKHLDLQESYGLTLASLREYLEPLDMYSGVGGSTGMEYQTPISCYQVGFKGLVSTGPFTNPPIEPWHEVPTEPLPIYAKLVDDAWGTYQ